MWEEKDRKTGSRGSRKALIRYFEIVHTLRTSGLSDFRTKNFDVGCIATIIVPCVTHFIVR